MAEREASTWTRSGRDEIPPAVPEPAAGEARESRRGGAADGPGVAQPTVRALLRAMRDPAAILAPDGRIRYANGRMGTLAGLAPTALVGRSLHDLFEGQGELDALLRAARRRRVRVDLALRGAAGPLPLRAHVALVAGGGADRFVLVARALPRAHRRPADPDLAHALALAEERAAASLREREVLLREVHHRVRNNLQVVASLLTLQARRVGDPGARHMFEACERRVRAMALIHQSLYRSPDLSEVPFAAYARTLLAHLAAGADLPTSRLRFAAPGEGPAVAVDTAIPLALVLNELAGDAIDAARGDGGGVEVEVAVDGGDVALVVARDREGTPAELGSPEALPLLRALVRQVDGTLVATGAPRAVWRLTCPLPEGTAPDRKPRAPDPAPAPRRPHAQDRPRRR